MARFTLLFGAIFLVACDRPADRAAEEQTAMDTTPAADAMTPASTPISLADVAGTWKVRSTDEAGGTPVETELVATADTTGWTMSGAGRKPIPMRVLSVAGDSIVTEAGPYESFVAKGVKVTTRTVSRLRDGKMVGSVEARYATKGGDSVAIRPMEGTRAP